MVSVAPGPIVLTELRDTEPEPYEANRRLLSSSCQFVCMVYEAALAYGFEADWGQWDATLWYVDVAPIIERHMIWLVRHTVGRRYTG